MCKFIDSDFQGLVLCTLKTELMNAFISQSSTFSESHLQLIIHRARFSLSPSFRCTLNVGQLTPFVFNRVISDIAKMICHIFFFTQIFTSKSIFFFHILTAKQKIHAHQSQRMKWNWFGKKFSVFLFRSHRKPKKNLKLKTKKFGWSNLETREKERQWEREKWQFKYM